jgi:hypothetical protein
MEANMRRILLAAVVACILAGGGWVAGQQAQPYRAPIDPGIRSGTDIGFRVEGKSPDGIVIGTWMVRLSTGEWVEAQSSPRRGRVIPLETR